MTSSPDIAPENAAARRLAFRSSWKGMLAELLILALSGMYFTLAFPGIGFAPAAWTGIVPLIWLCAGRTPKRAALCGFVWGYFWNLTACFFLREIMFFIPFVFAVILALFSACFAAAIPFLFHWILYPAKVRDGGFRTMSRFYRFHPLSEILCAASLSAWWTALEWIRSWIATGFPWNLAAATQWNNIPFIQICEYTGIYGVSFLVVFLNIAVFFALRGLRFSIPEGRYKRPWVFLLAVTLCLFVSWLGARRIQERRKDAAGKERRDFAMGIVQPHLSQRRSGGYFPSMEALDMCSSLSEELLEDDLFQRSGAAAEAAAMAGLAPGALPPSRPAGPSDSARDSAPLELIVWPESAVPAFYYGSTTVSEQYRTKVGAMLKKYSVPFLIGTLTFGNVRSEKDYDVFNSALLLKHGAGAKRPPLFRDMAEAYSKVHLVPYGEFIPLSRWFPGLGKLVGMGRDLTPGSGFTPLTPAEDVRAGVLICYEDIFPYAARAQALAGANMLLVITNDAWYPTSFEPEQHFANSVFRAVETGLPMVRCGNSDYSVLIDPSGRVADSVFKKTDPDDGSFLPDPGHKGKGAARFLVPLRKHPEITFYTRFGDLFVFVCWLIFGAGLLRAAFAKYHFRFRFGQSFREQEEKLRKEFLESQKKS